ncbi:MAG: aminopeptidase [Bacteroidales bacterium]|nr:aminopeptidase [Bacteroidales bacterium]MCB9014021.1 aminopeptidase [Bacteroidales bacterium]
MKKSGSKLISFIGIFLFLSATMLAQSGYTFTDVKRLPASPVKDQYRSGTCWSFSGLSFFESELMRMGKGEYNLSEMFVVRNCFAEKAVKYVRMDGTINFGSGGGFNDVTMTLGKFGIVPEEAYPGLNYGTDKHVHGESDAVLKAYVDAVVKNPNKELSTAWLPGFNGILDAYFGKYPESFTYKGKTYTPKSFEAELGLKMDDYVMVTSFTHHEFYKPCILEIPDNWGWGEMYNVKMDELTQIIDYSVENGYTVGWGADVSEKGFSWKNGLAVIPSEDIADLDGLEKAKWEDLSSREKTNLFYDFSKVRKEKTITQEMRQDAFDRKTTTDDHGMHIIGIAKDQNGTKYYIVKNSWNVDGNSYQGYLYASEAFVKFKTTDLIVNKAGVPPALRKKLGF